MRLEILVDNEDPLIFPMNKPKVIIGSNEVCDIVVNTNGVSRKHLAVVSEGDSFFVIDQGSTNGSYINEERLVPGRKVEFTSFFPVRLGDNVLLTLLSDEDAAEVSTLSIPIKDVASAPAAPAAPSRSDLTTTISLKNLKEASTQGLVKKRQEGLTRRRTEAKKVAPVKSEKTTMRKVQILAFVMIAAAVYYNFFVVEPIPAPDLRPKIATVGEETPVPKKSVPVVPEKPKFAFDPAEFTSKERIKAFVNDLKCYSEIEKFYCEKIVGAKDFPWGAVQVGTSFYIMLDMTPYEAIAKTIIEKTQSTYTPDANGNPVEHRPDQQTQDMVLQLVALTKAFPKDLNLDQLKDMKIYVALFRTKDEVHSVAVYSQENLKKGIEQSKEEDVKKAQEVGRHALPLKDLFQHY